MGIYDIIQGESAFKMVLHNSVCFKMAALNVCRKCFVLEKYKSYRNDACRTYTLSQYKQFDCIKRKLKIMFHLAVFIHSEHFDNNGYWPSSLAHSYIYTCDNRDKFSMYKFWCFESAQNNLVFQAILQAAIYFTILELDGDLIHEINIAGTLNSSQGTQVKFN